MPLSDLQSGTGSFPFLRQWPGCQGTDAVGLHFSTSIPDCSPPGWEGQSSLHQVSEGKSPLGSKHLGCCGAGHPPHLSTCLKFPSRAPGCPCPSMGEMSLIPQEQTRGSLWVLLLGLMAEPAQGGGGIRKRLGRDSSDCPSPAARPLPSPAHNPGSQWQPHAGFHGSGKN